MTAARQYHANSRQLGSLSHLPPVQSGTPRFARTPATDGESTGRQADAPFAATAPSARAAPGTACDQHHGRAPVRHDSATPVPHGRPAARSNRVRPRSQASAADARAAPAGKRRAHGGGAAEPADLAMQSRWRRCRSSAGPHARRSMRGRSSRAGPARPPTPTRSASLRPRCRTPLRSGRVPASSTSRASSSATIAPSDAPTSTIGVGSSRSRGRSAAAIAATSGSSGTSSTTALVAKLLDQRLPRDARAAGAGNKREGRARSRARQSSDHRR